MPRLLRAGAVVAVVAVVALLAYLLASMLFVSAPAAAGPGLLTVLTVWDALMLGAAAAVAVFGWRYAREVFAQSTGMAVAVLASLVVLLGSPWLYTVLSPSAGVGGAAALWVDIVFHILLGAAALVVGGGLVRLARDRRAFEAGRSDARRAPPPRAKPVTGKHHKHTG
ncbi:hypothetical protein KIK06_11650 [Nocardiopsis sp. EMB25]|uniref:hypothetical protein n=2 Tax=Nocardiopsis TaxID=2013 RepID=UPI002283BB03|nr:hypothetical protein [Nocardiopsis sp. EMB25]MCY9784546.1 hypothetical protein [Nocardiopsis sp. EMB25]